MTRRAARSNARHGQSTIEYAFIVAVVIAACIVMQVYVKRAMMGRYSELGQSFGQPYLPGRTIADDHLIQNGVDVDHTNVNRGTDDALVEQNSTFDETLTETGGDTVFMNHEEQLLP